MGSHTRQAETTAATGTRSERDEREEATAARWLSLDGQNMKKEAGTAPVVPK